MAEEQNQNQQTETQEQSVLENTPGNQNGAGNETPSFDDLLKNGHQAEFDRRASEAIATVKANWEKARPRRRTAQRPAQGAERIGEGNVRGVPGHRGADTPEAASETARKTETWG